jgi:hypothetical protein
MLPCLEASIKKELTNELASALTLFTLPLPQFRRHYRFTFIADAADGYQDMPILLHCRYGETCRYYELGRYTSTHFREQYYFRSIAGRFAISEHYAYCVRAMSWD